MKTTSVLAGLAVLAGQANAHYIFEYLTVNGVKGALYQDIRENTNMNSPVTDLTSDDLRCNVGATGANTATIAVAAGSSVTFTTDTPVYHDGPISFYMHKSPTTASADDGSGDTWFKIKDVGPTFPTACNAVWDLEQSYSVTIPASVPSGDYLLRVQSLAIHNPWPAGIPQFYISCAQITVTGGGNGVPSPLCSIPGFISDTDPGYVVNIYTNFCNYTVPGPAVWNGGGSAATTIGTTMATSVKSSSTKAISTTSSTVKTTSPVGPTTKVTTTTTTTSKLSTPTTTSKVATTTSNGSGGTAPLYGQCGGSGWTGPTLCAAGTCTFSNTYYSQCLA